MDVLGHRRQEFSAVFQRRFGLLRWLQDHRRSLRPVRHDLHGDRRVRPKVGLCPHDAQQTLQAHLDLRGKWLLPIHNGTFDLALHSWSDPFERIAKASKTKQVCYRRQPWASASDCSTPRRVRRGGRTLQRRPRSAWRALSRNSPLDRQHRSTSALPEGLSHEIIKGAAVQISIIATRCGPTEPLLLRAPGRRSKPKQLLYGRRSP